MTIGWESGFQQGVQISGECSEPKPSFHEHLAPSMQIWRAYQQAKCMWRKIRMLTPIQEVKGEEEGGKGEYQL